MPQDAHARADMFGMSHEINGEFGIGWNRRLLIFAPLIDAGSAPEPVLQMGAKYNYNKVDVALAARRTVAALSMLDERLCKQNARGSDYFIGDAPSALDFYWTAMSNLVETMSWEKVPVAKEMRHLVAQNDPAIAAAFTPILREHRDRFFDRHFKSPMEF